MPEQLPRCSIFRKPRPPPAGLSLLCASGRSDALLSEMAPHGRDRRAHRGNGGIEVVAGHLQAILPVISLGCVTRIDDWRGADSPLRRQYHRDWDKTDHAGRLSRDRRSQSTGWIQT